MNHRMTLADLYAQLRMWHQIAHAQRRLHMIYRNRNRDRLLTAVYSRN